MSNPIYPAIVPGLKVRHRKTLEERTVKAVDPTDAYFDNDFRQTKWTHLNTFWKTYEPLPQPGDRVRVVRSDHGHHDVCIGNEGVLQYWGQLFNCEGHKVPLSDFEVIPPEESETNMTDKDTADLLPGYYTAAQVTAALAAFNALPDTATKAEVRAAIDKAVKPKPRLVAVNLDDVREAVRRGDHALYEELDAQPGLLDTLDGVADGLKARGWLNDMGVLNLKDDFRIALGSDR